MAMTNAITLFQPAQAGFVAIAFSRAFRPTATHADNAVQFVILINK